MCGGKQTLVCSRTVHSLNVTAHFQKLEYFKNNYLLLTIKLLILALFGYTIYFGFNILYNRWYLELITTDFKNIIQNSQFLNNLKSAFIPAYLSLIPTIGIFINKQIGWFLITSFMYLVISSLAFLLMDSNSLDSADIVVGLMVIAFFLLIILIMNKEKIRNGIYNIKKKDLIIKNIIASIIGMGITIMVTYLKQ